jgi:hypothetical protein
MNPATTPITWFWQLWLAAVVFVFPLPGTIALRNLLLLLGLLALLATLRGTPRPRPPRSLRPAAWGLVAITTWLALHSVAVAPAPTFALGNLRGDWIVPLLTTALGCYAGSRLPARLALPALILPLLVQVAWMMGWQLWLWLTAGATGSWPGGVVPFGERDYFSSIGGFLLALTIAERLVAMTSGIPEHHGSRRAGWLALATGFLADAATRVRNGTLTNAVLLVVASVAMSRRQPRVLVLLVVVAALAGASAALDKRWDRSFESLVVGWKSDSAYWRTWDASVRPPTPSGTALEESAYARAAWAHEAIKAIAANPLGLGFGRDGFGRAVEMKYGYKGMVSSHSGWLDFALAAGIPGLALLLLTAVLAIRGGWRQFRDHDDAAGLMLAFTVGGYLLRCLLDGHFSGWRLGLFAFICGVLIAAMKPAPRSA